MASAGYGHAIFAAAAAAAAADSGRCTEARSRVPPRKYRSRARRLAESLYCKALAGSCHGTASSIWATGTAAVDRNAVDLPLIGLEVRDVGALLHGLELGRYAGKFATNAISGADLDVGLTERELNELGVSLTIHRKRLLLQLASFTEHGVPLALLGAAKNRAPRHIQESIVSLISQGVYLVYFAAVFHRRRWQSIGSSGDTSITAELNGAKAATGIGGPCSALLVRWASA